jgi:hypothetical protein
MSRDSRAESGRKANNFCTEIAVQSLSLAWKVGKSSGKDSKTYSSATPVACPVELLARFN